MIILGIHDGYNSSTALMKDWEIVCVQEEKLIRNKNQGGYPRKVIEEVLWIAGISKEEIDYGSSWHS